MNAAQLRAVNFVLVLEGGRLTTDAGGITRWGISAKGHPDVDIVSLTRSQAAEIYVRDYWEPARLEEIENGEIAARCLSALVHLGASGGARVIQSATNRALAEVKWEKLYSRGRGVKPRLLVVDGRMGPKTRAAANVFSWHLSLWLRCYRWADACHLVDLRARRIGPADHDRLIKGLLWRAVA